jgi:hypothetical protein
VGGGHSHGQAYVPDNRPRGEERDILVEVMQRHAQSAGIELDGHLPSPVLLARLLEALRTYGPQACLDAVDGWARERRRDGSQLGATLHSVCPGDSRHKDRLDRVRFWAFAEMGRQQREAAERNQRRLDQQRQHREDVPPIDKDAARAGLEAARRAIGWRREP